MTKKILFIFSFVAVVAAGCVKETYDLNNLSKETGLSPTFGIPAIHGNMTLEDLVKPSDTIVYDENRFMKLVVEQDSILSIGINDLIDMDTLFCKEISKAIGALRITPFSVNFSYTLGNIINKLPQEIGAAIKLLDGRTGTFPSLPDVQMDSKSISVSNFEFVTFESGIIEMTVENNLPASINGLNVTLIDDYGSYPLTFTTINSKAQQTATINLANVTLSNTMRLEVSFDGTSSAAGVPINLESTGLSISLVGKDFLIAAGRCLIPEQEIPDLQKNDTINFTVDDEVELVELAVTRGNLMFEINSDIAFNTKVVFSLPSALRNNTAFKDSVVIEQGVSPNGNMVFDNMEIDLATVSSQPYNRLPYSYNIMVGSGNEMIYFDKNSSVTLKYSLVNAEINYVKGFFGQREESFAADTVDINIGGLLDKVSGSVYFTDPRLKLDYINSVGVPLTIGLDVYGLKDEDTTDLNFEPFQLNYPTSPDSEEQSGTVTIDRTNSSLPDLLAMIPEQLIFGGGVSMYSDDYPADQRDSYVFGDSRIVGDLTVELPMELRVRNLMFADTLDNFLKSNNNDNDESSRHHEDYEEPRDEWYPDNEGSDSNSENFSIADNFKNIEIKLGVDNGFPLETSASFIFYDTVACRELYTLDLPDILSPAPVDADGKVTSSAHSETKITIGEEMLDIAKDADKIIVRFSLNTTGSGDDNVKIYADYNIKFNAAVIATADIDLSSLRKEDR